MGKWFLVLSTYFTPLHGILITLETRKILIYINSSASLLGKVGEGNGNPFQCSCLENPRDGEAWWAAVYGVTQSQTRLKWLTSSSTVFPTSDLYVVTFFFSFNVVTFEWQYNKVRTRQDFFFFLHGFWVYSTYLVQTLLFSGQYLTGILLILNRRTVLLLALSSSYKENTSRKCYTRFLCNLSRFHLGAQEFKSRFWF